MTEPPLPAAATELLQRQGDLATRAQLLEAGVSTSALAWRLGRQWRYVLPGVVSTAPGALDDGRRGVAALLFAGPAGLLAGGTAARYYGVQSVPSDPRIHVLVPVNQATRRVRWVHVHSSTVAEARPRSSAGRRWASKPRAVLDAARWAPTQRDRRAIVIEGVQRRIVTVEALAHELDRGSRRGQRGLREAIEEAAAGAWSVPEADLAGLLRAATELPEPLLNARLTTPSGAELVSPDLWFDDVAAAVMVHSRRHHELGDDWVDTVESDGELASHGAVVIGVTPTGLRSNPARVRMRIQRAYRTAASRPRPNILARPRNALVPRSPG